MLYSGYSGYIGRVELVEQPEFEEAPAETQEQPVAVVAPADKDIRITRLAMLNTRTSILSNRTRAADPQEVMGLAEWLASWVLR